MVEIPDFTNSELNMQAFIINNTMYNDVVQLNNLNKPKSAPVRGLLLNQVDFCVLVGHSTVNIPSR